MSCATCGDSRSPLPKRDGPRSTRHDRRAAPPTSLDRGAHLMTTAQLLLVLAWAGITMYALLGGADFGGGFWDALAGGPRRGFAQRRLIEHSIGPVWEANHVWLVFVIVLFW